MKLYLSDQPSNLFLEGNKKWAKRLKLKKNKKRR